MTYSEENRQQLIVRQSCMNRAVELLIARKVGENLTAEDLVKQVSWLTNKLEQVILYER